MSWVGQSDGCALLAIDDVLEKPFRTIHGGQRPYPDAPIYNRYLSGLLASLTRLGGIFNKGLRYVLVTFLWAISGISERLTLVSFQTMLQYNETRGFCKIFAAQTFQTLGYYAFCLISSSYMSMLYGDTRNGAETYQICHRSVLRRTLVCPHKMQASRPNF